MVNDYPELHKINLALCRSYPSLEFPRKLATLGRTNNQDDANLGNNFIWVSCLSQETIRAKIAAACVATQGLQARLKKFFIEMAGTERRTLVLHFNIVQSLEETAGPTFAEDWNSTIEDEEIYDLQIPILCHNSASSHALWGSILGMIAASVESWKELLHANVLLFVLISEGPLFLSKYVTDFIRRQSKEVESPSAGPVLFPLFDITTEGNRDFHPCILLTNSAWTRSESFVNALKVSFRHRINDHVRLRFTGCRTCCHC